jgi:hypothetical protein
VGTVEINGNGDRRKILPEVENEDGEHFRWRWKGVVKYTNPSPLTSLVGVNNVIILLFRSCKVYCSVHFVCDQDV